ncbi:hypothetical protein [Frankia sp. Cas3]|uniref:hypothetical protein n=1 Tax=Frankia sp. Cas3 TaxID=3073926 RepID=UPI002AD39495|nr:hypothetical protein [Frankia sp. Cas3]
MTRTDTTPRDRFHAVVATARSLSQAQIDDLDREADRIWTPQTEQATKRAYTAMSRADGLTDESIWRDVDEMCDIAGAAADTAIAVLAKDLISTEDCQVLIAGWIAARLPLPPADQPGTGDGRD